MPVPTAGNNHRLAKDAEVGPHPERDNCQNLPCMYYVTFCSEGPNVLAGYRFIFTALPIATSVCELGAWICKEVVRDSILLSCQPVQEEVVQ